MYPRPFEYVCARSLPEALEALHEDAETTKLLAGGQSLVPMLSLGLVMPTRVVDIGGLDLGGLEQSNGTVVVGALTRHRELELGSAARTLLPLAAEAAGHIGNPRVRNRGTFGGSLCHCDPSAELSAVALAYGGRVVLAAATGERVLDVEDFLLGVFTTAAQPDEILVRVELERPPEGTATAFAEVANRADDYAVAGAAAVISLDQSGSRVDRARVVAIGGGARAVRLTGVEERCAGEALDARLLKEVASAAADALDSSDDALVSAAYRRRCAGVCTARALGTAYERARMAA